MPIEIRELHISVSVTPPQSGGDSSASPASSAGSSPAAGNDAIVAACVEKVMEILQNKTER
jgi:hypothetical protein